MRREEVLLAGRVQGGHEGERRDSDSGHEEGSAVPAGVILPAPAPKPDESLAEENERNRRARKHGRGRRPGRVELGDGHGVCVRQRKKARKRHLGLSVPPCGAADAVR